MNKKVLLIAGGGTLGTYTKEELLKTGCEVDVICLEGYTSDDERLTYYKADANYEFLNSFLENKHYGGIVNFILYKTLEEYKPVHKLLCEHTEQLIFLSSYRVYGDLQHPITETAPQLFDVLKDERFLKNEDYAVPKSKCEHYIREESGTQNWTIVRPVISFSKRRFDIVTVSGTQIIESSRAGTPVRLPIDAKNLVAGLDWAGNSGKLIAHLLFNKKALGEDFTVSTAQNLTWGELADIYTELLGTKFEWIETNAYISEACGEGVTLENTDWYGLKYDRLYNRLIDNRKILEATGLTKNDFLSVKEGIKTELFKLNEEKGAF